MKNFLWFSWRPTCVDYKYPPTFPHTDCPDADPIPRPTYIPPPPPPPPYGYQPNRPISNPPQQSGIPQISMMTREELQGLMRMVKDSLNKKEKMTKLKYIFGEQND